MEESREQPQRGRKMSRREFLKRAGALTLAAASGELFNSLIGNSIEEQVPELPKLEGVLSEYTTGWEAKPWVWINLAIASQYLNSQIIAPGQEVSLIQLLKLDQMENVSRKNTDPAKGYLAAQMSNPKELSGWGYGLCLASTALFRAGLKSPVQITKAGTHYDIYPDYFKNGWSLGTDAAVFNPDRSDNAPAVDLVFKNPTQEEVIIIFQVFDQNGREITPPKEKLSLVDYKASYLYHAVAILRRRLEGTGIQLPKQYFPEYIFNNRRIFVRAAISAPKPIEYQVEISPPRNLNDGKGNVSFNRKLIVGDKLIEEEFTSQYGLSQIGELF